MRSSTRFWVRVSVSLGLAFTIGAVASRPTEAETAPAGPGAATPTALTPAKKALRVAGALKASNLAATKTSVTPPVRVTPMAPRHSSGAVITNAGAIHFWGASPSQPEGSYGMHPGIGGTTGTVKVTFPTVAGSLYVLDCAITASNLVPTKVSVSRGNAVAVDAPLEDGHILSAFNASAATTDLTIWFANLPPLSGPSFHSCELAKAE